MTPSALRPPSAPRPASSGPCEGRRPGRRRHRATALLPLLLLAPTACAPEGAREIPAATVRDSAGVDVVENPAPDPADPPFATLGPTPLLELGALEGPETHQFYQIQDVHRLADGRVAVVDGGSSEVRIFGPEGDHRATLGGPGDGPGEFRLPGSVLSWPGGDTLAVWDARLRRMSLFGPEGTPGRTVPLAGAGGVRAPGFAGMLDQGELVLTSLTFSGPGGDEVSRPPVEAVVVTPDGTRLGSLGTLPGREAVIEVGQGSVNIVGVPFARSVLARAVDRRAVFTPTDRWELRLFLADGTLERIVRMDRPPRPVTEADVAAAVEAMVARAPEEARPGLRSSLLDGPVPETMPALQSVLGGDGGDLWVEEFRPPHEEGPGIWWVLDPLGRLRGRVETPPGFTVFQAGPDFVLGRATDELGVERVQLWALLR